MIVRESGDDTLLVMRQMDHAALTGEFAARLADAPEPRGAFVAAARVHDNGWREADEAPLLDRATGRPHTFRSIPDAPYREVWERGMARAVALDPHVGLLVTLHGARFFSNRTGGGTVEFHAAAKRHATTLLGALGLGGTYDDLPRDVEAQSGWIAFLDGLSLFVCESWRSPWRADVPDGHVTVERAGDVVTMDPWPFGDAFEAEVPARVLPAQRWATEDAMRRALDAAPVRRLRFSFTP